MAAWFSSRMSRHELKQRHALARAKRSLDHVILHQETYRQIHALPEYFSGLYSNEGIEVHSLGVSGWHDASERAAYNICGRRYPSITCEVF